MLIEVRCEGEEEKAERLANCIKDVVKTRDGAKIWRPSRKLRMRLTGPAFRCDGYGGSEGRCSCERRRAG